MIVILCFYNHYQNISINKYKKKNIMIIYYSSIKKKKLKKSIETLNYLNQLKKKN